MPNETQLAESTAHVTRALKDAVTKSHHADVVGFVQMWTRTERSLTSLNARRSNGGSWGKAEEAEENAIEGAFGSALKGLFIGADVAPEVTFTGDARGPAIRVKWTGCPGNSFTGALVLTL